MDLFDPYVEPCNICAPHVKSKDGVCASDVIIEKISDFLEDKCDVDRVDKLDKSEIIEKAADFLKCDNEACILENKYFLDTLNNGEIKQVKKELAEKYIVSGPADDTTLLSNFNIDATLELWKKKFNDFMHISFQFIDFADYSTELESLDIGRAYEAGFRTIGCVLNTDKTGGRGKHWITVFIDMRPPDIWTIEFFNSSGNTPTVELIIWMTKIKNRIIKYLSTANHSLNKIDVKEIVVSKIVHQKSKTECGMYSLYYIWNRLKGKSYKLFQYDPVPDDKVTKFRKHVFR
jgi:hypothetical protein